MTETITLPISPTAFWLIVILVGTLLATLVAALSGQRGERPPSDSTWSRFLTRIGLQGAPETLALFGALFWAILALALAGGIIITLVTLLTAFAASPDPADTTLRWTLLTLTALTGALGAVVALPLTLIRIRQTQRQTNLQDESLFNDKINAAATDLAARQQVTRVLHADTPEECIATEWQDDLVTRAAAIDRLEGLALERADVAPRIARMLSIYVQELSREHPAKPVPEGASPGELLGWAQTLRPITRPDMERAVQSLGRINPTDEGARAAFDPTNIDLRRCNLQGFDLTQRNYQGARLDEAQIQGANLSRAQMQGAVLSRAQIQGADLSRAQMQGAVLSWAKMQGAVLSRAQMQGADLFSAQMQGAVLSWAKMQGADLRGAQISEDTTLNAAALNGAAAFKVVDDNTITRLQEFWPDIFYAAASLPDGHPPHWIAEDLSYGDFIDRWRDWAATLDPPVTIAPYYQP